MHLVLFLNKPVTGIQSENQDTVQTKEIVSLPSVMLSYFRKSEKKNVVLNYCSCATKIMRRLRVELRSS